MKLGKTLADLDGIAHYEEILTDAFGYCRHRTVYIIPCSQCGEPVKRHSYGRKMKYICDRCKYGNKEAKELITKAWFDEIETKEERRFNKALDRIQKQVKDFGKYERAIEIARTAHKKYGSVPEAMVAVELIRLGYSIIPQQKVGKYRVDFYIPKEKIVIEVDGALYHRDKFGGNREAEINLMLGLDTRIIHIPAELIEKKIWKLKDCIDLGMKLP